MRKNNPVIRRFQPTNACPTRKYNTKISTNQKIKSETIMQEYLLIREDQDNCESLSNNIWTLGGYNCRFMNYLGPTWQCHSKKLLSKHVLKNISQFSLGKKLCLRTQISKMVSWLILCDGNCPIMMQKFTILHIFFSFLRIHSHKKKKGHT